MKNKRSVKTTIGGLITAAGAALIGVMQYNPGLPSWLTAVGIGLSIFGPGMLGFTARDHTVSSKEAGVGKD